jgi:hypothetical protein
MDHCGNKTQAVEHVVVPHSMSAHANGASGFTPTGRDVATPAAEVAVIVLGEDPGRHSRGTGTPRRLPTLDVRTIDVAGVQIGNAGGTANAIAWQLVDLDLDGHADIVFWFDAAEARTLKSTALPNDPIGLHFVTHESDFLIGDVFALGKPVAMPVNTLSDRFPIGTAGPPAHPTPVVSAPVPAATELLGVAPNPFAKTAVVQFQLAREQQVEIAVFDLRGARVRTLVGGPSGAGGHQVSWNGLDDQGRRLARGVYLVRFAAADRVRSQKVVLIN